MSGFRIEAVTASTLPDWRQMRHALWPEMTEEENLRETQAMMMGGFAIYGPDRVEHGRQAGRIR